MINTIFYFTEDPSFDYEAAVNQNVISPYTIVFNKSKKTINMGGESYGQMDRVDIVSALLSNQAGSIADILPVATTTALGAIKIGYVSDTNANARTYGVQLDQNNRAFVSVPWTDTITPEYNDTELRTLISDQSTRIDSYIQNLNIAIKERTEQLFNDAQWVEDNILDEGVVGRNINDNIDEMLRIQYGVWNWVDDNDHSKGKTVTTSVIEQNVDSIKAYTGMTNPTGYNGTNLTTALSTIYADVGRNFSTGEVVSGAGMMADISEIDTTNGNIIKAISAALDLKVSQNGNTIDSSTDLASAISNGQFTGYSGLNTKVTNTENNLTSTSNLLSRVVQSDGTPNSTFKTNVIAGLATQTYVTDNVASARTSLIADINNKTAGITVFATKTGNTIDTGIKLQADQITLDGITLAQTVFAGLISADTVSANYATITNLNAATARISSLEAKDVTIENRLTANEAVFRGDVYANQFRAGSESGFNITVGTDSIDFNYGTTRQAWFTTKKLEMDTNGQIVDSEDDAPQGFYLYLISPKNGNTVTIDFDNLGFKELTNSSVQIPTHSMSTTYITAGSSGVASVTSKTIYYQNTDSNGNSVTTTYYWNSECTNQITGDLGSGYYTKVYSGYCVVGESVGYGSSTVGDKALRQIDVYQPSTYISAAGRIVGSGNKVYVIHKGNSLYFGNCTSYTTTLYNSSVYLNADSNSRLDTISMSMRISSDSSSVSTYLAQYSSSSSIPSQSSGTKVSIFKMGDANNAMSKVDYS